MCWKRWRAPAVIWRARGAMVDSLPNYSDHEGVSQAVDAELTPGARPYVQGKFIFVGDEKLYIRGVTYGPFRPSEDGAKYLSPEVIGRDFAQIAANGFNVVRTYTVTPPRWFLDIAHRHGL